MPRAPRANTALLLPGYMPAMTSPWYIIRRTRQGRYAPSFGDPAHALVQQMESGSDSAGSNYFATLEIMAGGVVTGGLRHCEVEGIDEARLLSTLIDDSYETASFEPGEDGPFEVGDDGYVRMEPRGGQCGPSGRRGLLRPISKRPVPASCKVGFGCADCSRLLSGASTRKEVQNFEPLYVSLQ